MTETPFRSCRGYKSATYDQDPHDLPNDAAHFYTHKTRCRACHLAYAADWRAGRLPLLGSAVGRPRPLAAEPLLDGVTALTEVLDLAGYTVVQAVARYAVFIHPKTVALTNGRAIFPIVRDQANRGQPGSAADGRDVLLDDNTTPKSLFLWVTRRGRGREVQVNHVWKDSRNPDTYTALWNLCATPAFLAKTTDGENFPEVGASLRFRVFARYGITPPGSPVPVKPPGYDDLDWQDEPEPVEDLEAVLRARMATNSKSRAAKASRDLGWLFSDFRPDPTVRYDGK